MRVRGVLLNDAPGDSLNCRLSPFLVVLSPSESSCGSDLEAHVSLDIRLDVVQKEFSYLFVLPDV